MIVGIWVRHGEHEAIYSKYLRDHYGNIQPRHVQKGGIKQLSQIDSLNYASQFPLRFSRPGPMPIFDNSAARYYKINIQFSDEGIAHKDPFCVQLALPFYIIRDSAPPTDFRVR